MKEQIGGFVAGNWKDKNMTVSRAQLWADQFNAQKLALVDSPKVQLVLFPPYSAAHALIERLKTHAYTKKLIDSGRLRFGGQDVTHIEGDAVRFTGSIHPNLLKDLGMTHVLIGHSERRMHAGETNDMLRQKLDMALKYELNPVFCVGETLQERTSGNARDVVKNQLSILDVVPKSTKIVVAYEPVWAIGTGQTATPQEADEMCAFVREHSNPTHVIYGGSVKAENAPQFFSKSSIDGALPGGASEDAGQFFGIAQAATTLV